MAKAIREFGTSCLLCGAARECPHSVPDEPVQLRPTEPPPRAPGSGKQGGGNYRMVHRRQRADLVDADSDLMGEVNRWLRAAGWPASRLGTAACGDPNLIHRLRNGGRMKATTATALRLYLTANPVESV